MNFLVVIQVRKFFFLFGILIFYSQVYLRDHPELFNANGKWIEMWLVLKKRTSNDKTVSGKIHIGLKVDKGIEIDELKKMKEDIRNKKGLPMADPRRTKLSGKN